MIGSSAVVKLPAHAMDDPLSLATASPAARPREINQPRAALLVWFIAPLAALVGLVIGWSLWGSEIAGDRAQQAGEVFGIVMTGGGGLLFAWYARGRNVQIERAYSAHLEELSQRLRNLAYRDSLTDLYNHRYFYEQLSHEVERAQRYGRPVSVILLDLDHFKEVNDTYGHLMGDKLLALMGQVINDQVRGADIAARYGGDEFAIILPDTPRAAAEATARKLARAVATGRTHAGPLSESLPLSASFGVACCPDDARSVAELLQLADDRVYRAKRAQVAPGAPDVPDS